MDNFKQQKLTPGNNDEDKQDEKEEEKAEILITPKLTPGNDFQHELKSDKNPFQPKFKSETNIISIPKKIDTWDQKAINDFLFKLESAINNSRSASSFDELVDMKHQVLGKLEKFHKHHPVWRKYNQFGRAIKKILDCLYTRYKDCLYASTTYKLITKSYCMWKDIIRNVGRAILWFCISKLDLRADSLTDFGRKIFVIFDWLFGWFTNFIKMNYPFFFNKKGDTVTYRADYGYKVFHLTIYILHAINIRAGSDDIYITNIRYWKMGKRAFIQQCLPPDGHSCNKCKVCYVYRAAIKQIQEYKLGKRLLEVVYDQNYDRELIGFNFVISLMKRKIGMEMKYFDINNEKKNKKYSEN